MHILFITSNRLGDAALSTGVLNQLINKTVNAQVTVACGSLAVSLFENYPQVTNVIPLPKQPYIGHWRKLWRECIGIKWDIIVDLRDSFVSRTLFAKKRFIWGKQNKDLHKVEQNAEVLNFSPAPSPKLWVDESMAEKSERLIPDGDAPVLAIGPSANWIGKTWSCDCFIELIHRMTADTNEAILPDARVAIFAAPGEEDIGYSVLNSIPKSRQIDLIAKTTPMEATAAIKRCVYYIGNDSGLMHCAAAVGTPTIGLFGPSYDYLYRPWGEHCRFVRTEKTYDELTSYKGYSPETCTTSLMNDLSVDTVFSAIKSHWQEIL